MTTQIQSRSERRSAFKLALIQMRVEGGARERNLERAAERIAEAADAGADAALLPEVMDLGWTHPSAIAEAGAIPDGATYRRLQAAARDNRIYVCAGIAERAGDRVYNAAVLIDPEGALLLHHRKLNELEIAQSLYAQGDRLQVCETPLGTIGLMICADAFARDRVIARSLGYMGADVILSPCSWAMPPDHDNAQQPYGAVWARAYAPVAQEFAVWIAGASNVGAISAGPWAGHNCIGCSQVTAPNGERVCFAPYGVDAETILYVDIVPQARPARGCGWADYAARSEASETVPPQNASQP